MESSDLQPVDMDAFGWIRGTPSRPKTEDKAVYGIESASGHSKFMQFSIGLAVTGLFAQIGRMNLAGTGPWRDAATLRVGLISFGVLIPLAAVFWMFWPERKLYPFFKSLLKENSGNELMLGSDGIWLSAGELFRGGSNRSAHARSSLLSRIFRQRFAYLYLPFAEMRSFEQVDEHYVFHPKNGIYSSLELGIGGSADAAARSQLTSVLGKHLPSETAGALDF